MLCNWFRGLEPGCRRPRNCAGRLYAFGGAAGNFGFANQIPCWCWFGGVCGRIARRHRGVMQADIFHAVGIYLAVLTLTHHFMNGR